MRPVHSQLKKVHLLRLLCACPRVCTHLYMDSQCSIAGTLHCMLPCMHAPYLNVDSQCSIASTSSLGVLA